MGSHDTKSDGAGHFVFIVRMQRKINAGTQFSFSFCFSETPTHSTMLPTFRVDPLSSVTSSGNAFPDTLRGVFPRDSDLIKSAMKIN